MKIRDRWITLFRGSGWFATIVSLFLFFPAMLLGTSENVEKQVVHLYFADPTQPFLIAETRVVINPGDPISFGRQLVAELTKGSINGNLATIPEGTTLRSFFLLEEGTAVVDFSDQLRNNHPDGCRQEQLTLFSIVNSLVLNIPEIDRVQILIAGEENGTLAGHMTIESPLTADMLLIR